MAVIKVTGNRAPYKSSTFRTIQDLTAGKNGVVAVGGEITEDLVTINLPPFTIVQNGLMITKDTPTGVSRPNLPAPYYLVISSPSVARVNDLIFSFAKTPNDITDNQVLFASFDGAEWKYPSLLSLAGVIKALENQNIATGGVGPNAGLKTVVASPDYRNDPGSLTDKNGQSQVFTQPALFPIIADEFDYQRVDRVVYRRPQDNENRVGVRKFLLGNAFMEEPEKSSGLPLLSNGAVSSKTKVIVDKDNIAHVLTAVGYGDQVEIHLKSTSEDRTSLTFGPTSIASATSDEFDALIDDDGILYVVFQTNGGKLRLLRYDLGTSSDIATTYITDISEVRVASEPSISFDPTKSRIFVVYKFQVASNNSRIYFKSVQVTGETVTGAKDISANTGFLGQPNLYVSDDFYLYVAWANVTNGTISYRIFDDIGVPLPSSAVTIVSAATVTPDTTLSNLASRPKIWVSDMRDLYVAFLQQKSPGVNGVAIYTGGAATMKYYDSSAENILGFDFRCDDVLGGYLLDVSRADGSWVYRVYQDAIAFSLQLAASGNGFVSFAKDQRGALYHSCVQIYATTFTTYQPVTSVRAIGPGLITSASSVNLDVNQALLLKSSFTLQQPRVGDRITFSGSTTPGNNVAKIVTAIDTVSLDSASDHYRITFATSFSAADTGVGMTAAAAGRDGNGSTGYKSVAETYALGFLLAEASSDVLLTRIATPGPTLLNWIAGASGGGGGGGGGIQSYLLPSGGTEVTWESGELTLGGSLQLRNIFTNDVFMISAGSFPMGEGEAIYVPLSSADSTPTPVVTTISTLPYETGIGVLGFVDNGTFKGGILALGGVTELIEGETETLGEDLPKDLRERLGFPGDDETYAAYGSTEIIEADDPYPEAIGKLDAEAKALGDRITDANAASGQNRDAMLLGGGRWTWDLANKTLAWSESFQVSLPGVPPENNEAEDSEAELDDGEFLYVTVDRDASGPVSLLTPAVGNDLSALDMTDNVLIARREGDFVYLRTGTKLLPSTYTGADGALPKVRVRLAAVTEITLPVGANPEIDMIPVEEDDLVVFLREELNGVYHASNVATSVVWTKLAVFSGGTEPFAGCEVFVRRGNYNANTMYIYDSFGWRDIANADVTFDQTGFEDITQTEISFDDGTRTFSITPTDASFFFYTQGCRHKKIGAQSIQIDDVEGFHFIYYDGDELAIANTYSVEEYRGYAFVATVYWDAANNRCVFLGDERHGVSMDWATRNFLHKTVGTTIGSGGAIGNYSESGDGSANADATFSLTGGELLLQDLDLTIVDSGSPSNPYEQILSPIARLPVIYRDGAGGFYRSTVANNYPVLTAGGRLLYNDAASNWAQSQASEGAFVAMWILATNDPRHPFVSLLGQRQDTSLDNARANAQYDQLLLGDLPSQGMKVMYRVIYQTSSAYTNAVKARIVDVIDLRHTKDLGIRAVVAQSHSDLTDRGLPGQHPASAISTVTSAFARVMSAADDTTQKALDTLDANVWTKQSAFQDRSIQIINGDTWSWNSTTNVLTWSNDAYFHIPGLPNNRNRLQAGNITVPSGNVVYVVLNRNAGASAVVSPIAADIGSVPFGENVFVFARRWTTDIVVGQMKLQNGESKVLGGWMSDQFKTFMGATFTEVTTSPGWAARGAPLRTIAATTTPVLTAIASIDAEIDKFFGQLRLKPKTGDATRILVTGADVAMLAAVDKRIQTLGGNVMNFTGYEICFQGADTGKIFASDGITQVGSFTPPDISTNQHRWYAVSLNPDTIGSDNRITVTPSVVAGAFEAATAAAAHRPDFQGEKPIGLFALTNPSGTNVISEIAQLGSGSGDGGGSGDSSLNVSAISANVATVKKGYILDPQGREIGSATDLSFNLKTAVNSAGITAPAANTVYFLYIDTNALPAATYNATTGRYTHEIVSGTSGQFIISALNPEQIDLDRYIPLTSLKTNVGSNYTAFEKSLAKRRHDYVPLSTVGEVTNYLLDTLQESTYNLLTPVDFTKEKATYLDASSTGSYARGIYTMNLGQQMVTTQLFCDTEFLPSPSIIRQVDLHAYYQAGSADPAAVYQISRDGGVTYQTVTMQALGLSGTAFRGTLTFTEEVSDALLQQNSAAQTTTTALNASNEITTSFTLTSAAVLKSMLLLTVAKAGSPAGYLQVYIAENNAGAPGTVIATGTIAVSAITNGVNATIDLSDAALAAGATYWLVVRADTAYRASYVAGTTQVALSVNATGIRAQYRGSLLDLRVKITSSMAGAKLQGFGVFYEEELPGVIRGTKLLDSKSFLASTNPNTFTINFIADKRYLNVYCVETGQTFKYPAITVSGSTVKFPADTFANMESGQVITLIFDQTEGYGFDSADQNASLLGENFLGSLDPAIDRSAAGRGIMLQLPNGTKVEACLDNNLQWQFYTTT